ncbi:hypothetical protein [Flavobacterium gilvum]|uniref:Peptide-N(4)-(N-acetyl-beta-glucosaminyl)asparagine amidase n=1 Tax=Flavobacterium gilvum TaxID=1492737 RepID=A0AAC9N4E2_9FLAO|nr:hypothetical protein [Flavobacterium gilvum]AOW10600.1 hypothetical protein EM308_14475 [Flavobacterium gilvum]KFC57847.1 hypothetical protein FEM08_33760 [Flavobacterium gilvum]
MILKKKFWLACFSLLFVCCNQKAKKIEEALKLAGNNRTELEKVINHYQLPKDSLKLKAAYFLIENMPGHYSLDTTSLHYYRPILHSYDSLIQCQKRDPSFQYNEIMQNKWNELKKIHDFGQTIYGKPILPDITNIKADYLINHIEYAFSAWRKGQKMMDINFETFCEYILPYRKKDGISIENWLPYFKNDSIKRSYVLPSQTVENMVDSIMYQYNEFKSRGIKHTGTILSDFQYLKLGDLLVSKRGTCETRCWFNTLLLSSVGIPSSIDYVPVWGNASNGHSWNSIILNNNKSLAFESFWDRDRWKYKRIYNNVSIDKLWGAFRLPKVFRYSYASQPAGPFGDERMNIEDIPTFFRTNKQKDVSSSYFVTTDIEVSLGKSIPENTFYLWICVFNNGQWCPVQWAEIQKNKAIFRGMGRDIVYMTGFYKNGELLSANNPFLLNPDGTVQPLGNTNKRETIQITRKFPPNPQHIAFSKALIGSEIQVANNKDFIKHKTIYKVSEVAKAYMNVIFTSLKHKYRYIRFLFPKADLNIEEIPKEEDGFPAIEPRRLAEIVCFEKTKKEGSILVQGKVLFSKGLDIVEANKCFDQNTLTYALPKFASYKNSDQSDCWLGLDFKSPKTIDSIGFCPQNDGNNVLPELTYELYYWKTNGWSSLGKQKAKTYSLTFHNVPKNAILLLHCIDEGKEERIFTYEKGKQVWW